MLFAIRAPFAYASTSFLLKIENARTGELLGIGFRFYYQCQDLLFDTEMEPHMMQQTSKSLVAGVLNLVSGVSALIGGFVLALLGLVGVGVLGAVPDHDAQAFAFLPALVFFPMAIFVLIVGALAVAGGIAAVQQKRWWLALIGTVASIFSCVFLGIPAIIFLVLGEPEFRRVDDPQVLEPPA